MTAKTNTKPSGDDPAKVQKEALEDQANLSDGPKHKPSEQFAAEHGNGKTDLPDEGASTHDESDGTAKVTKAQKDSDAELGRRVREAMAGGNTRLARKAELEAEKEQLTARLSEVDAELSHLRLTPQAPEEAALAAVRDFHS